MVPLGERPEPEQLVALEAALLSDPAAARALCDEVTAPAARDRCSRLERRPHLWEPRPDAQPQLPSPYRDTAPLTAPCGAHAQPRACWSQLAYGRAAAGAMADAAGACKAIAEPQWQAECMFQAGEAAVERRLAEGYADGLALCALAGRYQRDCLSHTVSLLAQQAPPTPDGDWAPMASAAGTITETWAPIDPVKGARWRDRLWAESLLHAYDGVMTLNGAPADVLPEDAQPHLRAAVAWRMFALWEPAANDLQGWTDALSAALASRAPAQQSTRPRRALSSIPPMNPPMPEEDGVLSWLGVSHRHSSPDPVIDGQLCLLEAAARRPGSRPLLEAARSASAPAVQEAARRLLDAQDHPPGPER